MGLGLHVKDSSSSSSSSWSRGPSRRCTTMSTVDSTPPQSSPIGRVESVGLMVMVYGWDMSGLVPLLGQLSLASPGVAKSSTSFGWGKGGNVTSAGWQVTLYDPMWHVSSRSGVATLRTAIHLSLTYLPGGGANVGGADIPHFPRTGKERARRSLAGRR